MKDASERVCAGCGLPLTRRKNEGGTHFRTRRYCDWRCAGMRYPVERLRVAEKWCAFCGSWFGTRAAGGSVESRAKLETQRFCSRTCADEGKWRVRVCEWCGICFRSGQRPGKNRYCSRDCLVAGRNRVVYANPFKKEGEGMMEAQLQGASDPDVRADEGGAARRGPKPLTEAEEKLLVQCEGVIGRGLKAALGVWEALETIPNQRLYRGTHARFGDYVRERWGITPATAGQYIDMGRISAYVAKNRPDLPPIPSMGASAILRELRQRPASVVSAWAEATEDTDKPSLDRIREVVDRHMGVSAGVVRDQRKRSAWLAAQFPSETPSVQVSLTPEEAQRLAALACEWELSLPETCRRLVVKELRELVN